MDTNINLTSSHGSFNYARKKLETLIIETQKTDNQLSQIEKTDVLYGTLTYAQGKADYSSDLLKTLTATNGSVSEVENEDGWIDSIPIYDIGALIFVIELVNFPELLLPSLHIAVQGKTTEEKEGDLLECINDNSLTAPYYVYAINYIESTGKYYLKLCLGGYFYWDALEHYWMKITIKVLANRGFYSVQSKRT